MKSRTLERPNGNKEMTAAQSFDLTARPKDGALLRSVVMAGRVRARQPEKWYEDIGEIHFGINRGAKIAGYAHISARKINRNGQPSTKETTSGLAGEIAARFGSCFGGQRGLLERYFTLMKVPGDCYMIRERDADGDVTGYDVIGSTEIDTGTLDSAGKPRGNGPIQRIMLPAAGDQEVMHSEIEQRDFLGRIWRPAIRYAQLADSPMQALDTQCEILHLLTLGLKGKLLSRLALNGILYIPTEIGEVSGAVMEGGSPAGLNNKTFARMIQAASWAITNFEDPRSALPIFASGPAAYAEGIKHIILDREIYQTDMALRAEMIDRILTGLDIQKAQTKGDGNQTHFQSFNTTDDEIRVNVKPDVENFMWAASRLVMNREFAEAGVAMTTASQYCLWYDLSDASAYINTAEDARQAVDRVIISDAAARKQMGFKEDDAPEGDQYIRQLGRKFNDPYLATLGMPEAEKIDWTKVGSVKLGKPETTPADAAPTGPGNQPGKPGSRQETDKPKAVRAVS